MAKAYWIARVTVTDPDQYPLYASAATEAIKTFGGRFLARGGRYHAAEGEARPRNVVIEFESLEQAVACYDSPAYQAAKAHRENAGQAEIVIVEAAE